MRWTIRRKLILSISIPLLITYLLILGWDYHRQRLSATNFMQDMMLTNARLTAGMINARLEQAEDVARAIATRAESRLGQSMDPTAEGARLPFRLQNDWIIASLVLQDTPLVRMPTDSRSRGFVIHQAGGRGPRISELPLGLDLQSPENAWYTTVLERGTGGWFGPMQMPGISNQEVCLYATPIRSGEDTRGVVAVVIPPRNFRQVASFTSRLAVSQPRGPNEPIAAASLAAGQLSDFTVVGPQGHVVCKPEAESTFREVANDPSRRNSELAAAFAKALQGESSVVLAEHLGRSIPNHRDEDYWAAFVPIPATGWVFATAVSETAVMEPVLMLLTHRALLMLAGLVLILAVVYFVSVRLSVPVERLVTATRRLGQGDLETQAPGTEGTDELAELSRTFNAMVVQIRQQVEDIRRRAIAQEKVNAEMRIAREIQTELLPRVFPPFPDHAEFDLHAINVPAEHVAGDFYDFFFIAENRVMLVIADVSGKGMPAAILMAVTRTMVRNQAMAGQSPLEIVRQVNRMLVEDTPEHMFVTMIIGQYDTTTGVLRYANAGHPAPFVCAASGQARTIGGSTAPLVGATAEWADDIWQDATLTLAPGDSLLLYTDGLTEARNADQVEFGEERVHELLCRCAGQSADETCRCIVDAVQQYEGVNRTDDLTLLALRRIR